MRLSRFRRHSYRVLLSACGPGGIPVRCRGIFVVKELRPPEIANEIPELWLPVPLEMCMKTNYWFNRNLLSHLRRSFCALTIVGALLTLPSVEAGIPGPASGGFNPCFNFAGPPSQAGSNTIITFNVTAQLTGTFTGSAIITERDIIHPDGTITLHGSGIFTDQSRCGTFLFTYS